MLDNVDYLNSVLKVLLGKMDRNLDEQIDRKELYAWILRSFK